ncbi:biosynthetic peptidoglycan transglycosylase, partial [Streptomyces sp. P17]|uniref:biosynthetic peptidoglycan transglycosylase n=1 Tax=Streptomyces sp. P17 TaxID=3074716 RepID=UPI0028F43F96
EIGGENREEATAEQIPQVLKDAVTSIEDQRFYTHIGIDPIRIVGSFISNLRAGGITQGGSTITQQLIKLSVFSTKEEDQTYKRKAQEA